MSRPPDDRSGRVEEAIRRRVGEQASNWFPGIVPRPTVRLRRMVQRPRAVLYAVYIGDSATQPCVLAKLRRNWPGGRVGEATGGRPRLVADAPTPSELTAFEYTGLREIHRVFGSGDPRFAAVRPLDHLLAEDTILMEYVDASTLRAHLVSQSRIPLRRPPASDGQVWARAGAWLARFQREVPGEHLPARQETRDAVAERFDAYGDFLAQRLGRRAVGDVARRAAELAGQVLPERVPLAVGHGDYAPRNVFVQPGGRVAVFDPLPRWRVPRYEDLSRFLVAIRLSGSQVHAQGTAYAAKTLDRLERDVIDGYLAEEPMRLPELRTYQLLVTLDRWSALVGTRSSGWRRRLRLAPVELASGHLRGEAERLIELVESAS